MVKKLSRAACNGILPLATRRTMQLKKSDSGISANHSAATGDTDLSAPWEIESANHTTMNPSSVLPASPMRSEEHTSELQSPCNLVCRLLLEKKKKRTGRDEYSARYSGLSLLIDLVGHPACTNQLFALVHSMTYILAIDLRPHFLSKSDVVFT